MSNENNQKQQPQAQPKQPERTRLYVWKNPIRQRTLVIKAATDHQGVYGIVQASPGKSIVILYGVHETSDPAEIQFLETNKSFNGENEDSFRRVTGREEDLLREIMQNSGCRRKDVVTQLRRVVAALNVNRSTAIDAPA